jgi:hypothetical protein
MPLLLEENHDRICLVVSPLNELEANHVRQWLAFEMTPISLSRFCSQTRFFYHKAWDTRSGREQRHTGRSREFHMKYAFQVLVICARVWATAGLRCCWTNPDGAVVSSSWSWTRPLVSNSGVLNFKNTMHLWTRFVRLCPEGCRFQRPPQLSLRKPPRTCNLFWG